MWDIKETTMLKRTMLATALLATGLGLAACGHSPFTRALTGGALGAGTGALISGVTGGNAGTGALIGGGVGAVGGAVTAH